MQNRQYFFAKAQQATQVSDCKHIDIFILRFATKILFMQNRISQEEYLYLLFAILYRIFITI